MHRDKVTVTLTLGVALLLVFSLSGCGNWSQKGIFIEVDKEIPIDDPVASGNIFSIIEYDGKIYAAGGKIYYKNPADVRGWKILETQPPGVVSRIANIGGLNAICGTSGSKHQYRLEGSEWAEVTLNEAAFPDPLVSGSYRAQGTAINGTTVSGIDTITALFAAGDFIYVATKTGACKVRTSDLGTRITLEGTNVSAAIGSYHISAIYARTTGGRLAIYVGTIGRGTTYGTKNNGIWAYYSDRGTWNRE
jgi:hypothetical protein